MTELKRAIKVSEKFISDKNYSGKEKDIFIEFIRSLERKEVEEVIDKVYMDNNPKKSYFENGRVKCFVKDLKKELKMEEGK